MIFSFFFHKKNTQKGFTLIEIMVAISIFSIVMLVAIGSVLAIVSANKKAQALNSVITNLNFALEGMVRDLRTGYNYGCNTTGTVEDCDGQTGNSDQSAVTFISSQYGNKVTYYYSSQLKAIMRTIGDGSVTRLTSNDVKIDSLVFYVKGSTPASGNEYSQPKIIIVVKGTFNGFGSLTTFSLQSMVSQRKLDI